MMILVGRSLPNGIPWTLEEDKELIIRERLLWAQMTTEEQTESQEYLAELWNKRGAVRNVTVESSWGKWAMKLPSEIVVPDSAFGMASAGFRPWVRGPWDATEPMQWLWLRGFQVVDVSINSITMVIPPHRTVQESERLMRMLVLRGVELGPNGRESNKTSIKSSYDPLTGVATLELLHPLWGI